MRHDVAIKTRLPKRLADAVRDRASVVGASAAQVVREAVAEKLSRPADPRDVSFAEAWLNGADAGNASEEGSRR